jgi:hypothetical protein
MKYLPVPAAWMGEGTGKLGIRFFFFFFFPCSSSSSSKQMRNKVTIEDHSHS